ncbi:MAG TPA: GNAT family N-acetyltransferase, partial [Phnomibacter sp.]|nr:GNAT family N-acetyltransferase [Phnomibacter sp.]
LPYQPAYRNQLLQVWEASVQATHHFLQPLHWQQILTIVHTLPFENLGVYCLFINHELVAFLATSQHQLSMLFVAPQWQHQGLGSYLLHWAIQHKGVTHLDVNAQNDQAIKFYESHGFELHAQSPTDDLGLPYPIWHMHRSAKHQNARPQ